MVSFNGALYINKWDLSDILCFPSYYKVGARPSVEPLYKNTQKQTMTQMYQLNINDWAQT